MWPARPAARTGKQCVEGRERDRFASKYPHSLWEHSSHDRLIGASPVCLLLLANVQGHVLELWSG